MVLMYILQWKWMLKMYNFATAAVLTLQYMEAAQSFNQVTGKFNSQVQKVSNVDPFILLITEKCACSMKNSYSKWHVFEIWHMDLINFPSNVNIFSERIQYWILSLFFF